MVRRTVQMGQMSHLVMLARNESVDLASSSVKMGRDVLLQPSCVMARMTVLMGEMGLYILYCIRHLWLI